MAWTESGKGGPRETTVPVPFFFFHPARPGALLDRGLRRGRASWRLHLEPADLAQPWPQACPRRFPASGPVSLASETRLRSQPPLPYPLCLRLQAPPAPPPANVALGPGPGPDSATRPSRSPRSSKGETRRAPGPGPTLCQGLDTWIILVGGWVGGRVG